MTGQHYDDDRTTVFLRDLSIRAPDAILTSGADGRSHWEQVYECGRQMLDYLKTIPRPDLTLFLGDSNSVLAAIALKKEGYRIGRVEALMRAYTNIQEMCVNGDCPLPEELNRTLTDKISDILFTYHEDYLKHADRDGIPLDRVHVVGNTIVEPVKSIMDPARVNIKSHIILDIHRHDNIEDRSRLWFIIKCANRYSEIFNTPVKMLSFGRTISAIQKHNIDVSKINIVPLMGYRDFIASQQDALFSISDSGSAMEELPLLGVPCIVPRRTTERPQSTLNNNSTLLQMDEESFEKSVRWLDSWSVAHSKTEWLGSGNTSQRIVDEVKRFLA